MVHRRVWSPLVLAGLTLATLATLGWGASAIFFRSLPRHPDSAPAGTSAPGMQNLLTIGESERPETSGGPVLDPEQRAFLWEVEHRGNVLSRHGFGPLAGALAAADAEALSALLAEDFQGQTPASSQAPELDVTTEVVRFVRWRDDGRAAPEELDRAGFVAWLMEHRQRFDEVKAKLALMNLAPEDRDDLDHPWRGTGQLRLWGRNASGGPVEVLAYLSYQIRGLPTEESLTDGGWLREARVTKVHVAEAPRPLLPDVAAERGIDLQRFRDNWLSGGSLPVTGGVYLTDYDRDGRLDMLLTDVQTLVLYRGLAEGKFADVSMQVGLSMTPLHLIGAGRPAAFADLDGDGWDDLILGDQLYRNEQGRRFTSVSHLSNLRLPYDATGVAIADFDRDGRLDLYVTVPGGSKTDSWLSGHSGHTTSNQLLRNLGNWQFEDVTEASGTGGGHRSTFSAVWLDANNNGWPDLYVINEFGNGVLLVNQTDGTFAEHLLADEPVDFGSMGVTAGDIDNDGRIDLYIANMYSKAGNRIFANLKPDSYPAEIMATMQRYSTGSQLWRNRGDLEFERLGPELEVADIGWSYGPALADLDNDGWLDIYAPCGYISRSRDDPDG